jgi:hypothetical protein
MVDGYTKVVLTMIAIALVWIAASLTTVPTAQATAQPRTAARNSPMDVNVASVGGVTVTPRVARGGTRAIPVTVFPQ